VIVAIDGKGLLHRIWHAAASTGPPGTMCTMASQFLERVARELAPDAWLIAWERRGPTWRHQLWPQYKAGRKTNQLLIDELKRFEAWASERKIPMVERDGYEADDILASVSTYSPAAIDDSVLLLSDDKDVLQCLRGGVRVLKFNGWRRGSGLAGAWDEFRFYREWGVVPDLLPDLLALMGDESDNIPGLVGVGKKRAMNLVAAHGGIEQIAEASPATKETRRVADNLEQLVAWRKVCTLEGGLDVYDQWAPVPASMERGA